MLVKGKRGTRGERRDPSASRGRKHERGTRASGSRSKKDASRRNCSSEIVRCSLDIIVAVDLHRRIIEFNEAAENAFGYSAAKALGSDTRLLYDDPAEAQRVHEAVRTTGKFTGEVTNRRKDKTTFRTSVSASLLRDAKGLAFGYSSISRDITDSKKHEETLRKSERFLSTIFDSIKDPFSIVDRDYRIVRVNDAYAQMRNRQCEELVGRKCFEVLRNRTSICDDCVVEKTFQSSDPCAKDKLLKFPGGGEAWVEIYTYPIVDDGGQVSHVIEYTRDVTCRWRSEEERKRLIERLEYLSNTDVLTGLLNRRALIERLNYEVERAMRYKSGLSLILCDIDYFKEINDSCGHTAGDRALKTVAGILKNSLRSADIVGRYGGDEFMLILPETSVHGAAEFAERTRASIEGARIAIRGKKSVRLSISLGVTNLGIRRKKMDVDSMIKNADSALYYAKRTGRNRICISDGREITCHLPGR